MMDRQTLMGPLDEVLAACVGLTLGVGLVGLAGYWQIRKWLRVRTI
jgi:hypothetical protein